KAASDARTAQEAQTAAVAAKLSEIAGLRRDIAAAGTPADMDALLVKLRKALGELRNLRSVLLDAQQAQGAAGADQDLAGTVNGAATATLATATDAARREAAQIGAGECADGAQQPALQGCQGDWRGDPEGPARPHPGAPPDRDRRPGRRAGRRSGGGRRSRQARRNGRRARLGRLPAKGGGPRRLGQRRRQPARSGDRPARTGEERPPHGG